jgi:acetoacetate decarboxylase
MGAPLGELSIHTRGHDCRGPHSADRKNSAVIGTQKSQAWTGPATLFLVPHALAPVAELPVVEVVSAIHICADLTLGLGEVVHDYLRQPTRENAPH